MAEIPELIDNQDGVFNERSPRNYRNNNGNSWINFVLAFVVSCILGIAGWNLTRITELGERASILEAQIRDIVKRVDENRISNDDWHRTEKQYDDAIRLIIDKLRQDFDRVEANQQVNSQRIVRIEGDLYGYRGKTPP